METVRSEHSLRLPLYSASKTAATDLTAGLGIGRPPEESARPVLRLATLGKDAPTGTLQDEFGELLW